MTAATRGQPDRGDKTAGRRRASGRARWREDKRHGSHGTHDRQEERREGREGRKGGRREGHGWPRASGVEEGTRKSTAAGREQGENEKKRYINI